MFNWLKDFYTHFKKSLIDFSYYSELIATNFYTSLKYLFTLLIFVALINGLVLAVVLATYLPQIPNFIVKAKSTILSFYPSDLVLTVKNSELSTNVQEPYYLDPVEITRTLNKIPSKKIEHFVTIDTAGSMEKFDQYKTAILVTKNMVIAQKSDGGYEAESFNSFNTANQELIITKDKYDQLVGKFLPYLDQLKTISLGLMAGAIILWPFVGGALYLSNKFLYLAVFSIIFLIIAKIMKKQLSYQKIFQLGMHALTLPIIIDLIQNLFHFYIPFIYPVIFIAWMMIIISKLEIASCPHCQPPIPPSEPTMTA